jgi:hypothetical protein
VLDEQADVHAVTSPDCKDLHGPPDAPVRQPTRAVLDGRTPWARPRRHRGDVGAGLFVEPPLRQAEIFSKGPPVRTTPAAQATPSTSPLTTRHRGRRCSGLRIPPHRTSTLHKSIQIYLPLWYWDRAGSWLGTSITRQVVLRGFPWVVSRVVTAAPRPDLYVSGLPRLRDGRRTGCWVLAYGIGGSW